MPRTARASAGGICYHVLNRGNGRSEVFHKEGDCAAFVDLLAAANERLPLRILRLQLMGNHWHFVVWPRQRQHEQVSELFRWLTITHSQSCTAHQRSLGTASSLAQPSSRVSNSDTWLARQR